MDFADGFFSVQLGALEPFDALFDGSSRWLDVTVDVDPEMTPRAEIASVPYALVYDDAIGAIHPESVAPAHLRDGVAHGTARPRTPGRGENARGSSG